MPRLVLTHLPRRSPSGQRFKIYPGTGISILPASWWFTRSRSNSILWQFTFGLLTTESTYFCKQDGHMYLRQFCIDDIYVYNSAYFPGFLFIGIAYVFDLVGGYINKKMLEFTDLSRDQEVSSIDGVVIRCRQVSLPGCAARQAFCRFKRLKRERLKNYGITRQLRDPCFHQI